jgi:hypothetical protein
VSSEAPGEESAKAADQSVKLLLANPEPSTHGAKAGIDH